MGLMGKEVGAVNAPHMVDDAARAFAGGSIRKGLGLELADLRFGLDVAKNHLQRGAAGEAMRIYVALVLCEPMEVDFQVGLCNCALVLGEYHLALQAASAVVALAPADPRGYLLSGRACLGLGHKAEAIEDLSEAAKFGKAARDAAMVQKANDLLQAIAASSS